MLKQRRCYEARCCMLKTNNWLDIISIAVSSYFVVAHLNMYGVGSAMISLFYWLLIIVASIVCMHYKKKDDQLSATLWTISRAISQLAQVVLVWLIYH